MFSALKEKLASIKIKKEKANNTILDDITLYKLIEAAGYFYDATQDIFYSTMDAWQRDMGYCRLYDEAAAPMGMIIDCEPIYFNYAGKRWLIEFWKGQYDLTTGCEIGVYTTDKSNLNIPDVFEGPFYKTVDDENLLQMSYILRKKDETLFVREGKHWWLTGFKLGEFSQPYELIMDLTITLKDKKMLQAFIKGLNSAGYLQDDIKVNEYSVSLKFDKPRTAQPITRTLEGDFIIQWKNELMCKKYQELTKPYDKFPDKIRAIQQQAPELSDKIINIVRTKYLFGRYEKFINYLN